MRVLVVDDCEDNQFLIKTLLTRRGATVETSGDGTAGAATAMRGSFDVVLMDIQMPECDGFEALKILKNSHYAQPVVALTASNQTVEKMATQTAGFSAHVTKPIEADHLVEVIQGLVHER